MKEWRLKIQVMTIEYGILMYNPLSTGVGVCTSLRDAHDMSLMLQLKLNEL